MSLFVKVCGVTTEDAAHAAVAAGADAIGFVFAPSPREVTPARAAAIAAAIPRRVLRVAVFRRPAVADIYSVLARFPADLVQADQDCLPADLPALPVYREGSPARPVPGSRFLFEGPVSGSGRRVDMTRAAEMGSLGEMVLAGGLDTENVAQVVLEVEPYGVDVSSGVERCPGRKDPRLIADFVAAARAADKRTVQI